MKIIKVPEIAIEGIPIPLRPTQFKTGSTGFYTKRRNLSVDGKLYWLAITMVEQHTQKAISNVPNIQARTP